MPDQQIVVCAPLAEIAGLKFDPETAPYSTYTQVECPHCRQGMWLGARGRVEVEAGRAQMICVVCAVQTGVMGPGDDMKKLTDRDA
jgi:hypothetical protein